MLSFGVADTQPGARQDYGFEVAGQVADVAVVAVIGVVVPSVSASVGASVASSVASSAAASSRVAALRGSPRACGDGS